MNFSFLDRFKRKRPNAVSYDPKRCQAALVYVANTTRDPDKQTFRKLKNILEAAKHPITGPRDIEILFSKSRSVNKILMTSTRFSNGNSSTARRPKGTDLQKGTHALYLTLDEIIESRKERDVKLATERRLKDERKAERER